MHDLDKGAILLTGLLDLKPASLFSVKISLVTAPSPQPAAPPPSPPPPADTGERVHSAWEGTGLRQQEDWIASPSGDRGYIQVSYWTVNKARSQRPCGPAGCAILDAKIRESRWCPKLPKSINLLEYYSWLRDKVLCSKAKWGLGQALRGNNKPAHSGQQPNMDGRFLSKL